MPSFSVILPAAGASTRFGTNKLLADLSGQPVIVRSINAFSRRDDVSQVIIATRDRASIEQAVGRFDDAASAKLRWCDGGETRAHTVRLAAQTAEAEWLAIHDAARPLISQTLIDRTFAAALTHSAAAPAMPVHLTIKQANPPLPATIQRTIPRHNLFAMQTPQCMRRADLLSAFERCPLPLDQVTDDVQLLELIGLPVTLVAGEEANLKLTTPLDLHLAHLLLNGL